MERLRVDGLRHDAVCLWETLRYRTSAVQEWTHLEQIDDHVPLSTVTNEVVREVLDDTIV